MSPRTCPPNQQGLSWEVKALPSLCPQHLPQFSWHLNFPLQPQTLIPQASQMLLAKTPKPRGTYGFYKNFKPAIWKAARHHSVTHAAHPTPPPCEHGCCDAILPRKSLPGFGKQGVLGAVSCARSQLHNLVPSLVWSTLLANAQALLFLAAEH